MNEIILTERQQEIYDFICDYIKQHKYSPSIREISKAMYISIPVVKKHLEKLVDKHYLSYTPKIARSYFPN